MKKTEIETFQTENESFKVAIISDSQLPPTQEQLDADDTFLINLKNALTVIKNNDVDMILYAGDIGDLGTRFAFQTYMDAIEEVFGEDKPIIQTIMGNHDYWNKSMFTAINHRKAFQEIVGQSPWTHYVVNGYHFIGVSPDYGSMTAAYNIAAKWLDEELQKAQADSDGKPIFVMTHNQPVNTSYGSEDWGDSTLNAVLEKYPNVINFSGHVHYSLLDERSIWQGAYTVINTQSLSYTELEEGKENGTIPPNASATPMGYIMEFQGDEILLHRINFADGNTGKEQKANMLWSFSLPYTNDGRYAFDTRKAANQAPVVTDTGGTATLQNGNVELTFAAAEDDDFVHSYKVVIDDKETKYFFSDFYNGLEDMQKTVTLTLPEPTDGTKHIYKIYAVDSWNAESTDFVQIETE
ncbi:MAG: metallophosphoesterase family protein [Candidatus Fimenecus sp.]